jgi:biotin carboxyl carrier protein
MKGPKTMAKKPLGPEGARFKKADWNPQATGSKGTYISERDALEARVAELEKVNGITVETVSLTRGMIDGDGPFIVKFLEPDGAEFEYAALSGDPSATRAHFAQVAKSQIADKESDTSLIAPPLGEMADATVASWLKNPGDYVVAGELIVVIETDKATIDLEAEISGQMGPHLVQAGDNFKAGESIGSIVPFQANSDAQWPYASALPPVAVIKSPAGERFISMPIAGTLKHLQADLAKVQLGDDLFSVAISPPYFIRWKQGRELYEATLLKEARAIRTASQYTPERINALITGGDAVMKERDRLRDQISKDKSRVANATVVESKLGGFAVAAAIGWIAAIGLYIYSDLPIPFVGGPSSEAQITCATRLAGQNGATIPIPAQLTFVSDSTSPYSGDSWFSFNGPEIGPSDGVEITSIKLRSARDSAGGEVTAEIMNRSAQPIGQFAGSVEIAKMSENACQHETFENVSDLAGTVIQPGTSATVTLNMPRGIASPTADSGAVIWLNYQPISARPSER